MFSNAEFSIVLISLRIQRLALKTRCERKWDDDSSWTTIMSGESQLVIWMRIFILKTKKCQRIMSMVDLCWVVHIIWVSKRWSRFELNAYKVTANWQTSLK